MNDLLSTKTRVPPQPHHMVRRTRLMDGLEHGVPQHKLILLSAPAGYGKTTLLAQWAQASRFLVAWVGVDEEDNDLERFLRYLLAAWEEIQPEVRESPLGLLLNSRMPNREAVLSAFVNLATDLPEHLVFVLDDYHLIQEPAIHQALTFLLDHLPPKLHFVLAGRSEPPLPLARYRARRELLEFRTKDLHFLLEESSEFLNLQLGLELSHDEVVSLQTQLEGWIAGLQLASLTLRRHREAAGMLMVSGRHRFIADYLSDVLGQLSEDVRVFLLQTSILERLSGALCDAVTGKEHSQKMLKRLEQENLFLMPLDDNREWFRYHRLFADFLHDELNRVSPGEIAQLHRRAARWYFAHDLPEQSLRHAVAGNDAELGIQIGERYFEAKLLSSEFKLLTRWLDALPEQWYSDYPSIGLMRVGVLMFTGAFDAGIRCINEIEQALVPAKSVPARWHLARVTAIRCSIACIQNDLVRAEHYAEHALQTLPAGDYTFRAGIHHALGDSYRRNGRWHEARECYLRVLDLSHVPTFHIRSVHVLGGLADLELRQGRLRTAAMYWKRAFAALEQQDAVSSFPLPLLGWLHLRMGEILYEWNDLTEAEGQLAQGLKRAELGGDARVLVSGYLTLARLNLTLGNIPAASKFLEQARPLVESVPDPEWQGRFDRFQLELWLAQDKLRTAANWADENERAQPGSETAQLAVARVLVVKGDAPSLERALALLRPLLEVAKAEGRVGVQIEVLGLQALARWRRGDSSGALTSLEPALRLAAPEGYVRLFADLGLSMARLLQEAHSRQVMQEYVGRLLGACTLPSSVKAALSAPLTRREQQVLPLVAAGLTNREIAERLGVSAETVKKHIGNICGKLHASNRTEAVARAKDLALLD